MPRRRLRLLAVALVPGALLLGCSETDGRTLPPADPAKTTTTVSTPVVPSTEPAAFTLSSASFVAGEAVPIDFTCEGAGVSPDLTWVGTPVDSAELALVVRDRTADGYLHWVVANIDPLVAGFGRGGVPEGAVEATNGAGTESWDPPCPPAGGGPHVYELTLHSLPGALALQPGTSGAAAADLIEQASVAQATVTLTYAIG